MSRRSATRATCDVESPRLAGGRDVRSALTTRHSPFAILRRAWRDESGQGMLLAAASILVLVGFVALVYNVGNVVDRRTRMQMAADSAAYSGAQVLANSLSTIGWINSAMAQIYYNAQRYAVDVNVTAVAALAEMRVTQGASIGSGPAYMAHREAYDRAQEYIPMAKAWLVDLTRIENAVAILAPRLAYEEMFAVAKQGGAERLSAFPHNRLFPREGSTLSYRIEQFAQGWRITNLIGGSGEMVSIRLQGDEWVLDYSNDGLVTQRVVIRRESADRWRISYYEPPGNLVQEIYLVRTENLGWVVWGSGREGGSALPRIEFEPVDMDGDGTKEGTRVTYGNTSQVFRRSEDNNLYVWNFDWNRYVNMTSSEAVIGGVRVQINVTNVIQFPGATAHIGDPTEVTIGRAHLTLHDPPTITTGLGPVSIHIRGFDPDAFSVSVGEFSLTRHDADGRWRTHFDRNEELYWRQRLTAQSPEDSTAQAQWQYDRQVLGTGAQYEPNIERYIYGHVYGDRHGDDLPPWTKWFDPVTARPRNMEFRHDPVNDFAPQYDPENPNRIRTLKTDRDPPDDAYYITVNPCPTCRGTGVIPDAQGNPGPCPTCNIPGIGPLDHDRDGKSDIRVFIRDVLDGVPGICDGKPGLSEDDYLDARIYSAGYGLPIPRWPLVLSEDFFRFGVNAGVWRDADPAFLLSYVGNTRQRFSDSAEVPGWSWGYVALASARIGIPEGSGFRYQFDTREEREDWCEHSPYNLYVTGLRADLIPTREQVKAYDLDEDILMGAPLAPTDESPTSYLYDAVLGLERDWPYEAANWTVDFEGRSDPRINALIRNMRTRSDGQYLYFRNPGARFDFGSGQIDELALH